MKLTRRNFLKSLAATAAGTALARVAVAEAEAVAGPLSQVREWTPDTLSAHEPLEPFGWTADTPAVAVPHELLDSTHCDFQVGVRQPWAHHVTCAGIPVDADVVQEIATGYTDTEFDSMHNLGLEVGSSMPALLTLKYDGQTFLHACGDVHLRGFTAGWDGVVYHYYFGGYDVEEDNRETEQA